jgi:hypothetical protein
MATLLATQKHPREPAFRNASGVLKLNEVVWSGDLVADERLGFELWETPGVFGVRARAHAVSY